MHAVKGILLDLDDTLLDERGAINEAFSALMVAHRRPESSREAQFDSWRSISARHWLRHVAGEVTFFEQRRRRVREFLGTTLSDEEADEAFRPYAEAYERAWKLLPGVDEFLGRTLGIPKVIVTNGDRNQQIQKVHVTGLAEHVIGIVTPADCGRWKPHPEIFLAGISMLGVAAAECIMVGDDELRDIEPARRLGIHCFLVESGHEERDISRLMVRG